MRFIILTILCLLLNASLYAQSKDGLNQSLNNIKSKAEKLKSSFEASTKALVQSNESASQSTEERVKQLDSTIKTLESVLSSVSENGELFVEITKGIEINKEEEKRLTKLADQSTSAKNQTQYENLSKKYKANVTALSEARMTLNSLTASLKKKIELINKDKDFIVEMLLVEEMESATKALLSAVDDMKALDHELGQFVDKLPKSTTVSVP
jgi:hypothetical protein